MNSSLQCPVPSQGRPIKLVLWAFLTALFLVSGATAFSATTILSETFEGAFPASWSVGDANSTGTAAYWDDVNSGFGGEGTHGGSWKGYCAAVGYAGTYDNPVYRDYMSAYMSRTINLSGYNVASLTFWHKIPGIEDCCDAAKVYIDNDLIWSAQTEVYSWTQVTLSLNRYAGGAHTLKFQFDTDSSVTYEGWYLDDITVAANNVSGAPSAITWLTPGSYELVNRQSLRFSWAESLSSAPASWFHLIVTRSGEKYLDRWTQDLSWQPTNATTSFPGGDYISWVQGWNPSGLGPWSSARRFSVETNIPAKPTLYDPVGTTVTSPSIYYDWSGDSSTAWYELYVQKNGAAFADKWGQSSSSRVNGHSSGQYQWWVRGWSMDGMGPWSDAGSFSVSLLQPSQVRLYAPIGTTSSTQAKYFDWATDSFADWYCLMVNSTGTNYTTKWVQYTSACTLSNDVPPGNYSWRVAAWNSEGMGPWSTNGYFTVATTGTPYYPIGTYAWGSQATWCYKWYGDTSGWYELYINKNGAPFYHQWLSGADLTVPMSGLVQTCIGSHTTGVYAWWVRPWSPVTGLGPWSTGAYFTLTP